MNLKIIPQLTDTYRVYEGPRIIAIVVDQNPIVDVVEGILTTAQQIEATKLIRAQQDARRATLKGGLL